MNSAFREALAAGGSAIERIRRVAYAAIDLANEYPHMARLRLQASAVAASDDELRPAVRTTVDLMLKAHAGLLREAIDRGEIPDRIEPDLVASLLTGQAFLLYVGRSLEHEGALGESARRNVDHLLQVLLKREDLAPEDS